MVHLWILFFLAMHTTDGVALSNEKRLIKHLLDNYAEVGLVGRPVFNASDTIHVQFGVALIQIIDLDEKNQVLTTSCWNRYHWVDILLRWDPKDFGGVDLIRVPTDNIWTPDIVLYNYADDRLIEIRSANAVVQHTGDVMWIPQAMYKSSCVIDITNFPFDTQECKMKFGSWTYDGYKLDIGFYDNLEEFDLNDYIQSNEWNVLAHPAYKNTKYYPCCKEPFPDLTFHITLKRKVAFYNYILILPCVLLSSLTLVLFWLPPESPAKMILGMNIFVAFFVLLLLLAESTPPAASSIPLIGAYYCLNMILITLSTFLSVIVINLYFCGDKRSRVPVWLRTVFIDVLARILCMRNELLPAGESSKLGLANGGRRKHGTSTCTGGAVLEMSCNKFQLHDAKEPSPNPLLESASNNRLLSNTAAATLNHRTVSPQHTFISACLRTSTDCLYQTQHAQTPTPQHPHNLQSPQSASSLPHLPTDSGVTTPVENDVKEIRRYLRQLIYRVHQREERAKVALEWKIAALVLDRIFFFMYLSAIIISLGTIFPKTY